MTDINCALPLPKIIAHRGGKDDFPENTIPAFQRSVAAGVDGIELDVQVTKDGVPVLFHPRNLPDGAPAKTIAEVTLTQLQQWNSTIPEAQRIRPLLDALDVIPTSTMIIVDLKSLPAQPLIDSILKTIPPAQQKRFVYYSTDHSHIDYLASKKPDAIHFETREATRSRVLTQLLADRCETPNAKDRYVGFELYRDVTVTEKLTLGDGNSPVKATFWTPRTVACTHKQAPNAAIVMIGINSAKDYDQAMMLGAQAIYSDTPIVILAHRLEIQRKCTTSH